MTENKFDFEHLEEGDSFEGSPIEQSGFISELQAAGGEFELKGNRVVIKKLAKKETPKAKAEPSPKKEAPKAEAKEEAPKKEAPKATDSDKTKE